MTAVTAVPDPRGKEGLAVARLFPELAPGSLAKVDAVPFRERYVKVLAGRRPHNLPALRSALPNHGGA